MSTASSVRVFVRFRPVNARERAEGEAGAALRLTDSSVAVSVAGAPKPLDFAFDGVFGPTSTQEQLYDTCARAAIEDVLRGYNATLFAYGQTGAGKSHVSMCGDCGPCCCAVLCCDVVVMLLCVVC